MLIDLPLSSPGSALLRPDPAVPRGAKPPGAVSGVMDTPAQGAARTGGLAGRPAGGCWPQHRQPWHHQPYATAATPARTSLWKSRAEASPQLPPRPGEMRGPPPCLRGSSVPSCPERVAHPTPEFSRGFSCPPRLLLFPIIFV